MNKEQVVAWAREAGFTLQRDERLFAEMLERFAFLVAAAERDRMCEQFSISKELAHEKAKSDEANRTKVLGKGR